MDDTIKLALETVRMNKQAIVFVSSKASAERTAEDIANLISKIHNPELLNQLSEQSLKSVSSPTKQCKRLAKTLKKGIAFHHSGLASKQRDIVEDNFRNGDITIICCTPTLAAGLSLPAYRVILKSLKRFSGKWGMDWIPVLEYMQMAGRAGRPEHSKLGEAISISRTVIEKDEIYNRYICGVPEDIYSKLAAEPVLRTYLLSLIASGIIKTKKEMKDFFRETFWAAQYNDFDELESIMDRTLKKLIEWGFVVDKKKLGSLRVDDKNNNILKTDSMFVSAKDMWKKVKKIPSTVTDNSCEDKDQLRATMIGKRVSQLYLDPLTARSLLDRMERANKLDTEIKIFSYLQAVSNTIEMRPLLRVKKKEFDLIQSELLNNFDNLLQKEPDHFDYEYSMFMNSIKTALFFESWANESGEDLLFDKFDVRPGEIRAKLEIANWLLYSLIELTGLLNYKDIRRDLRKLRYRLKNGVKEELLPLLKLKGVGRKRARRLYNNGLKDFGDLKKVDLSTLSQLIGKAMAVNVKNQLGEDIPVEVSAGKRKGQLGLNRFGSTQ
ncbi:hypothetical protein HN385_02925 [archaeon]|nr:hypothetical protein [archaeon]MBT3450580.1 hypothetical protein [archaeon]MBT6868434.1 hypothetical protein [archaeon]MBT7193533.1 hypothetical protein [archaeon]MBT7381272.1 hypothetical protein [archaeon]